MRLLERDWYYTATDLVDLLDCEVRSRLNHALAAGTPDAVSPTNTPDRLAAEHGLAHERDVLEVLRARYGDGVVEIEASLGTVAGIDDGVAATARAAAAGAPVIYQGVLRDGAFYGRPDFLIRADLAPFHPDADGPAGAVGAGGAVGYEPYDSKLARHAGPAAVLQLVSYAAALPAIGVPVPDRMHLLLGDKTTHTLAVAEFTSLCGHLHDRMRDQLAAAPGRVGYGDQQPACGSCKFADHCAAGREEARDLSLVARIRPDARTKLLDAGIGTLEELAAAADAARPPRLAADTFVSLRAQARLQVAQDATRTAADPTGVVSWEVISPDHLAALPAPSAGDVYFDMEGDPYAIGNRGLEYLFGAITLDSPTVGATDRDAPAPAETFTPFWAHDVAGEKAAFEAFVDFAAARIAEDPGAHIYHYAPYEVTALKRLAAVHGTCEAAVDDLLRTGRLIDLYAVVRNALRVSQRSYSIKYLEPLYMPSGRGGEVTTAASSIEAYEDYLAARERGEDVRAQQILDGIADYNAYDCVSTHRLHRWLLGIRDQAGIHPAAVSVDDEADLVAGMAPVSAAAAAKADRVETADRLRTAADQLPVDPAARASGSTGLGAAVRLLADLVCYFDRESNPAWWEHFARTDAPTEDLEVDTDCYVPAGVRAGDWAPPEGRQRKWRRSSTLVRRPGQLLPFRAGDTVQGLYRAGASSSTFTVQVTAVDAATVTIVETGDPDTRSRPPLVALLPAMPIAANPKDVALAEYADRVAAALPGLPRDAVLDLLSRSGPRLLSGGTLPAVADFGGDVVAATLAAVDDLDCSVLAVQGPPGAGKSYLARRLIAHLAAQGRSVGVCAASHKAIENVLAPAAADLVDVPFAKRGGATEDVPWQVPASTGKLASWVAEQAGPFVVGGTAWHFAGLARTQARVDVLIVDEAGQFALADAAVAAGAASNVVLLGDPQQLPQVTQGAHPDGADTSALGHLIGDSPVIESRLGYFLDASRRMRPEVCGPVSQLSYAGKLSSHPVAAGRHIVGVPSGVHPVPVAHSYNSSSSVEEAAVVVSLVGDLIGREFRDAGDPTSGRLLGVGDVMVVAPFNAQVRLLREELAAAGFADVAVGTVDKFQGQEAPVVVVSMTSSAVGSSARGAEFLLSRNRMNVAVSRAQVAAYVVASSTLHRAPVRSVEQLRLLAGLVTMTAPRP